MAKHKGLALLDAALTYIEHHPDEWDQGNWHCGTTACLAGHIAVTIAGGRWYSPEGTSMLLHYDSVLDDYNHSPGVDERARRLLGDAYVAGMFEGHHTFEDLLEIRETAKKQVKKAAKREAAGWVDFTW